MNKICIYECGSPGKFSWWELFLKFFRKKKFYAPLVNFFTRTCIICHLKDVQLCQNTSVVSYICELCPLFSDNGHFSSMAGQLGLIQYGISINFLYTSFKYHMTFFSCYLDAIRKDKCELLFMEMR